MAKHKQHKKRKQHKKILPDKYGKPLTLDEVIGITECVSVGKLKRWRNYLKYKKLNPTKNDILTLCIIEQKIDEKS